MKSKQNPSQCVLHWRETEQEHISAVTANTWKQQQKKIQTGQGKTENEP